MRAWTLSRIFLTDRWLSTKERRASWKKPWSYPSYVSKIFSWWFSTGKGEARYLQQQLWVRCQYSLKADEAKRRFAIWAIREWWLPSLRKWTKTGSNWDIEVQYLQPEAGTEKDQEEEEVCLERFSQWECWYRYTPPVRSSRKAEKVW